MGRHGLTKSTEGDNGTAQVHITVYGSDFEKEKVISNNARITSTGNTRTRRATKATISECDSTDITSSIEQAVSPDNMDGGVTETDLMNYLKLYGESLNVTADGYYYSNNTNSYGVEVFGLRYPYYFVLLKNGKAYRVNVRKYVPDFTGSQWTSNSWTDYENATDMVRSFVLHDLDGDKGYSVSEPLIVTQSLFNDDSKYEYVRTLRKAGAKGGGGTITDNPSTNEESPIQTKTLDETIYGVCGYEVVSEDGSVLFTIEIDDDDVTYYTEGSDSENIMVVKMNGELYFITPVRDKKSHIKVGILANILYLYR